MKKMKRVFLALFCIVIVIAMTACSSASSDSQKSNTNTSEKVQSTSYPLKIKDSYGREVTIKSEPKKVVSVAPNITETVFAVKKGKELVGRTDFCLYPADTKNIQSIGGMNNPNIEKIVDLKPDVVIASSFFPKDAIKKLEDMNIPVVALYSSESFEGAYDTIKKVGQIVNANDSAASVIDGMKKKVASIEAKVKGKDKPSVYYVVSYGSMGDYTAGGDTFVGKMIEMAGGKNAAGDVKGWSYSVEKLVEKNPDILICSKYNNSKDGIKNTNGYKNLSAVKNNKLIEIDNNLVDIEGPRLADGLEAIAKAIHPEVFK